MILLAFIEKLKEENRNGRDKCFELERINLVVRAAFKIVAASIEAKS